MIYMLLLGLCLYWVVWTAFCLAKNYARARRMGVPIVLVPISQMNILWIVIQYPTILILERFLGSSNLTRYGSRDWHFRDRAQAHIKFGNAWALVTPGEIWLNVVDPGAIVDIFQRRTQFLRPVELYQLLNVFGRNASTVSAVEWKQHRKIISAPFNELANNIAWTESLNQVREMLTGWIQEGTNGSLGIHRDTRSATLNVLAATGFNQSYKFHETSVSEKHEESYRAALFTLMDNSLFMQLVPKAVLSSPYAPASWKQIGRAANVFKRYMLDLLHQEELLLSEGKAGASHLTSSLLRASEEYSQDKQTGDTKAKSFTINELLGNIYLINVAGHDTTSNTLAYAIIHLAMSPDVQEWISEEIHVIVGDSPSETWEYESTFKRLKRPLAVMYETLRLFPPIMALPKSTKDQCQNLDINGSTIMVPSNVYVVPSLLAVQSHPAHWGEDALVWKPSRWINGNNEIVVPRKGTYLTWSEGAQNCPGKKFSQVTFVAVIASLFQFHWVKALCAEGESKKALQARLQRTIEEASHGVLLRMKDADSVRLAWTR
ncbi:cytochrome P450, partial [Plenodomus tracheiphilus IPT5]